MRRAIYSVLLLEKEKKSTFHFFCFRLISRFFFVSLSLFFLFPLKKNKHENSLSFLFSALFHQYFSTKCPVDDAHVLVPDPSDRGVDVWGTGGTQVGPRRRKPRARRRGVRAG